jgi:hypothetical protein
MSSNGWGTCLSALLLTAAFGAGCGEDGNDNAPLGVTAYADWPISPATADALGYTITVSVVQRGRNGACASLPDSTRVLVNGQEAELAANEETGCMLGSLVLGPFLQDQSVTVTEEKAGQVTATATFKNLLPGTAATLVGPSELHAGDDIVIRPVPAIPANSMGLAAFYLLDSPGWDTYGLRGESKRSSDGLHVRVPAFTGRAVLAVWGQLCDVEAAEVTCPGFADCRAGCAGALGPFFVTGVP